MPEHFLWYIVHVYVAAKYYQHRCYNGINNKYNFTHLWGKQKCVWLFLCEGMSILQYMHYTHIFESGALSSTKQHYVHYQPHIEDIYYNSFFLVSTALHPFLVRIFWKIKKYYIILHGIYKRQMQHIHAQIAKQKHDNSHLHRPRYHGPFNSIKTMYMYYYSHKKNKPHSK